MKKKTAFMPIEAALSVDLTIHDFSVSLLTEFAEKIVRPYYSANMSEALKDLICKSIREEDFVLDHIEKLECRDYG